MEYEQMLMDINGGIQMNKINYRIYATILDAYQNFIDSDKIYQKYYGFSDNPPFNNNRLIPF